MIAERERRESGNVKRVLREAVCFRGIRGVNAFATNATDLAPDVNGYFAP